MGASQSEAACLVAKIRVSLYVGQMHAHVCAVWMKSIQAMLRLVRNFSLTWGMCIRLLWRTPLLKVKLLFCFWGNFALFCANSSHNWSSYITHISCSLLRHRCSKLKESLGFDLMQFLRWLGTAIVPLSFKKAMPMWTFMQQNVFYLHLLQCEVYIFLAIFFMLWQIRGFSWWRLTLSLRRGLCIAFMRHLTSKNLRKIQLLKYSLL